MPLVSILIPAYNAQPWIAETITSALEQTWPRKEIIVVDDGSSDQTLGFARQFASRGVNVVTQPNQGASAARNKALSLSQGEFIQWLDADDLLAPDKIERQMRAASLTGNRRTLYSAPWAYFVYRTSKARFEPSPLWCDLTPIEWLRRKLEQNLFMQPATWLVSRELTEAAGPWDTRLSLDDDGEYFCRVARHCEAIQFVPEARVFYRRSGSGSLSAAGHSKKKLDSQFLSIRLQIACVRSLEDSAGVRAAGLKFLQAYLVLFYPERADILQQAEELASSLSGELSTPRLAPKYAWVQKLFGWRAAKRAESTYNRAKSALIASWDKTCFQMETRASQPNF